MPSVAFTLRLPSLYNASAGGGSGAGIVLGATRVGKGNTQHPFYHTHACIPTHLFLFYFYFYFLFLLFYFYFYFYSTSTYRGLPLSLIAVLPGRSWPFFLSFFCALFDAHCLTWEGSGAGIMGPHGRKALLILTGTITLETISFQTCVQHTQLHGPFSRHPIYWTMSMQHTILYPYTYYSWGSPHYPLYHTYAWDFPRCPPYHTHTIVPKLGTHSIPYGAHHTQPGSGGNSAKLGSGVWQWPTSGRPSCPKDWSGILGREFVPTQSINYHATFTKLTALIF